MTEPPRRFTFVRPSNLPLARRALVVKVCLGHYPLLSHASLPGTCGGQGPVWTLTGVVTTSYGHSYWCDFTSRSSVWSAPTPSETHPRSKNRPGCAPRRDRPPDPSPLADSDFPTLLPRWAA